MDQSNLSLTWKSIFVFFLEFIILLVSFILINTSKAKSARKVASPKENPCQNLITGSFVANSKGCEYFFYCHNGQALEAFCPGDFWFNEDSGMCDHPSNVDCWFNEPEMPDTNPQDEQIRCPGVDSKDLTFLGSTVECGRYYICYHGKPIMQLCIPDLHWNPIKKKCDYPHNVNCKVNELMFINTFKFYILCENDQGIKILNRLRLFTYLRIANSKILHETC